MILKVFKRYKDKEYLKIVVSFRAILYIEHKIVKISWVFSRLLLWSLDRLPRRQIWNRGLMTYYFGPTVRTSTLGRRQILFLFMLISNGTRPTNGKNAGLQSACHIQVKSILGNLKRNGRTLAFGNKFKVGRTNRYRTSGGPDVGGMFRPRLRSPLPLSQPYHIAHRANFRCCLGIMGM